MVIMSSKVMTLNIMPISLMCVNIMPLKMDLNTILVKITSLIIMTLNSTYWLNCNCQKNNFFATLSVIMARFIRLNFVAPFYLLSHW